MTLINFTIKGGDFNKVKEVIKADIQLFGNHCVCAKEYVSEVPINDEVIEEGWKTVTRIWHRNILRSAISDIHIYDGLGGFTVALSIIGANEDVILNFATNEEAVSAYTEICNWRNETFIIGLT